MNPYPAIVIGGPPHSGKSVLVYSLTQALRQRQIEHYVLRACPDGEGDWANEAQQTVVQQIRVKGDWSSEWVAAMCGDIANRHLPLLVDVGGKPTAEQEAIFAQCTHAILLTRDEQSRAEWQRMMARHEVPIIADLRSVLVGAELLISEAIPIQGVITGLQRSTQAQGIVFDTLVDLLAQLCQTERAETRRKHLANSPVEIAVDLERLAATLGAVNAQGKSLWQPQHIATVLDYLPQSEPLAIYGRGTNWLYAAIARYIFPAAFWCFDVRLGWVRVMPLQDAGCKLQKSDGNLQPVSFLVTEQDAYTHLEVGIPSSYLSYQDIESIIVPKVSPNKGLLISGKLPLWFYASLAQTYVGGPWLAIYQPQLAGYVTVFSRSCAEVGTTIPATYHDIEERKERNLIDRAADKQ